MTVVQAPEGASLQYTTGITKQVEQIILKQPEVDGVFAVDGFSFSGASPNRALLFTRLKAFEERPGDAQSAAAVTGRCSASSPASPAPSSCRFCRRRFRASARSAASRSRCSISRAGRSPTSRPPCATRRARQRVGHADAAVHELHRQRSAARRADQPRAGQGARAEPERRHRDAADPDGLALRQRLRLQQPLVPRLRAGGSQLPMRIPPTSGASTCARRRARWSARRARHREGDDVAAGHLALQPVSIGRDQRTRRRRA